MKNKLDLEAIIGQQGEFRKFVYGCRINAELLPFADNYIGAYIANLSVHLVDNPKNQVFEAYRVLKPGSAACFTVWGSKDHSYMFNFVDRIIMKYVSEEQKQEMLNQKSAFDFYTNKDQSKQWMEEAGFKGIKIWEHSTNIYIPSGEGYM